LHVALDIILVVIDRKSIRLVARTSLASRVRGSRIGPLPQFVVVVCLSRSQGQAGHGAGDHNVKAEAYGGRGRWPKLVGDENRHRMVQGRSFSDISRQRNLGRVDHSLGVG